ncbi:hypothetical protein ABZX98_15375 [Streptomyces sp. NPDC002992]
MSEQAPPPHPPRPRWVTALLIGAAILVVALLALHVAGSGMRSHG